MLTDNDIKAIREIVRDELREQEGLETWDLPDPSELTNIFEMPANTHPAKLTGIPKPGKTYAAFLSDGVNICSDSFSLTVESASSDGHMPDICARINATAIETNVHHWFDRVRIMVSDSAVCDMLLNQTFLPSEVRDSQLVFSGDINIEME